MPSVLIATALALETRAVISHLEYEDEITHPHGAIYPSGRFPTASGTCRVSVVETGMGNVQAASEVTRAIDFVNPDLAFFVGVAAGVKDVRIGDVVVGSKVYYTEHGKAAAQDEGGTEQWLFRPRPEADRGNYRLVQLARSVARIQTWKERLQDDSYAPAPIVDAVVDIGPIAAVEKVIANKKSDSFRRIKAIYGDSKALEMEGHGFSLGAYMSGDTPGLVIRGISDLVEGKGDADQSGSQPMAAGRAAAFAFEILSRYPFPVEKSYTEVQASPASLSVSLRELGAELYPEGPQQRALWERSGGDPAQLPRRSDGRTAWFEAVKLVLQGGGGANLSVRTLLAQMILDYPNRADLLKLSEEA